MKKVLKKTAIASLIIAFVGNTTWFIVDRLSYRQRKALFEKHKAQKGVYAYHTYMGALNSAMYFKDKDSYNIFKNYYDSLRLKREPDGLGFERIRLLPFDCPLIIIDSQVHDDYVEVVYFEDSVDYLNKRGYVLKELLHNSLPPDSLMKANRRFYDSLINK